MSKLTRVFQKQFGVDAGNSDVGIFGSLAASSPQYSKDPETIQSLNAFLTGWAAETIANNRPALEDFNAIDFLTFYQLCYLLQTGVAEWNAETTYYIGSIVQDGSGNLYKSIADSNLNHAVSNGTYWTALSNTSLSGLTTDVLITTPADGQVLQYEASSSKWKNAALSSLTGIMRMWMGTIATIPTGWLFCNGAAISRTTYSALFSVIGTQYGSGDGSTTFNLPDMRNFYPVGAKQDDSGVSKSDANYPDHTGAAVLAKTRSKNNIFYPNITDMNGGSTNQALCRYSTLNDVSINRSEENPWTSFPNYVAVAYMIKY